MRSIRSRDNNIKRRVNTQAMTQKRQIATPEARQDNSAGEQNTYSTEYVEVAVFSPLAGSFTYRWPQSLGIPTVGIRIRIPFGNGKRSGIVLGTVSEPAATIKLKTVADRLDTEPLLSGLRLQWMERVQRYYLVQPGELWRSALGWSMLDDIRKFRCLNREELSRLYPALANIFHSRAAISMKTIRQRATDKSGIHHTVRQACRDGLMEEIRTEAAWNISASDSHAKAPRPTTMQQQAIAAITTDLHRFHPFLLFGRTGSGKTEVYLQAATTVIADGGQVLVLVPEIGLTPLWLARLRQRFNKTALWHSAMTAKERLIVREHLTETEILIGTRSALFLPLPRLAMIVIDEEHDASFKQQEGMAYSARDMGVLLAQQLDIPIVLGSATPSLESWNQVKSGHYQRLNLPSRIQRDTASIASKVVDMRGVESPVSEHLLTALQQTLKAHEQSILFLNRRGYAPALQCTACGDVPQCPDCSLRLTLHRKVSQLRCHSCGFRRRTPKTCEACGEAAFLPLGEGTEKLEEWLCEHIPELRFARFDRDVITSHARLEQTLTAFERGEFDCLIGTQMLVKGHDFPNVTLVGVINADLGVNLPDFRAGERWWQQMTQVTGRAGRGTKAGRVVIQTRMPEADWFDRIDETQAESTLDDELKLREMLSFPPFSRWVRVVFSSPRLQRAETVATAFVRRCQDIKVLQITGPMPCPMERKARQYRIEVLLRDNTRKLLPWAVAPVFNAVTLPRDVRIRIDVDPQDMM